MDKYRDMTVEHGTGLRKQHTNYGFKGSVNEFLESIRKYNSPFIQVFERIDGELVLLWSKDNKGLLQQGEQMELF
ncbi:hypothetical protein ETH98_01215 [Macrococcoides caseolyticum]|uniref:hypothetical protein n=1 Tax=Macrococcoides TaxID=3076173 RepID=UPI000C33F2E3|nr:hypothetical protein [Macrococcus]MDJ1152406.1 hypothetical protein [Macrococcus caseolyticus]PKE25139.1 hypothetical protein CW689_01355 [Macrococcus caseolyticus]PKF22439.1 hypothetical protein CW684_01130 [Macrococcus caseolyticus]PKF28716.1 hypothetical protein CW697_11950 [Macrococcus caseolyticus]PKF36997.1 hypothetical protein CW687_00385 [Macrococcus caseolyticus]